MKAKLSEPQFVYRKGKATGVLLDLSSYKEMLERLEDLEDLKILNERRKKPQTYRPLEEYLAERAQRV